MYVPCTYSLALRAIVCVLFLAHAPLIIQYPNSTHRNLSAIASEEICDDLVKEDIMTPLSAMFRNCLSRLEQIRKNSEEKESESGTMQGVTGGDGQEESVKAKKARHRKRLKIDIEQQQLAGVLEQGLHLLWNVRYTINVYVHCMIAYYEHE